MNNVEKLPFRPFTKFCMSIGQVPTSYLAGLTIEEQLLWFCSYLEKNVIPAVNNNAEAVEELQALYVQLKDYVDHYFDNLDVQEEINNKLDDMAEKGELTDIIAQYLELAGVLIYNSIEELKDATNLADGSIAKTLGFYNSNDNGGAYYKIRTITNEDIIDNMTLFAITNDNTLVSELIQELPLNPLQFGAYGDATHDDHDVLEYVLNLMTDKKSIDLKGKSYLISEPLSITENISNSIIKNGTIKASEDFTGDYLIEFPGDFTDITVPGTDIRVLDNVIIDSVSFDCNNECGGIKLIGYLKFKFDKLAINNYITYGIATTRMDAHELMLTNTTFYTGSSNTNAIAISIMNNDNMFENILIRGGKYGIKLENNNVHCNQFNNVHIYGIQTDTDTYKKGIYIEVSASNNIFNNIYMDGCAIYSKCYWGLEFDNVMFLECKNGIVIFDTTEKIGNIRFNNCYVYYLESVATPTYVYTLINNTQQNISRNNKSEFTIQASGSVYDNSNVIAITNKNHYNYFNISNNATKYEFNGQGYIFQNPQTNYNITVLNNECIVNSFNSSGWHWYGFEVKLEKNTDYIITDLLKNNIGNIKVLGTNNSPDTEGATTTIIAGDTTKQYMRFNSGEYDHILLACYNSNMAPEILKVY